MKIIVWTNSPVRFIKTANVILRDRRHADECLDPLKNHFEGYVAFNNLSEYQFCALENAAVRMGLEYDGRQEM